jgi:hypothetical protein
MPGAGQAPARTPHCTAHTGTAHVATRPNGATPRQPHRTNGSGSVTTAHASRVSVTLTLSAIAFIMK